MNANPLGELNLELCTMFTGFPLSWVTFISFSVCDLELVSMRKVSGLRDLILPVLPAILVTSLSSNHGDVDFFVWF